VSKVEKGREKLKEVQEQHLGKTMFKDDRQSHFITHTHTQQYTCSFKKEFHEEIQLYKMNKKKNDFSF